MARTADPEELLNAVRGAGRRCGRRIDFGTPGRLTDEPERGLDLTVREREVLALVAEGFSNRQIADSLFIAERTARTHVSNVLAKLDLASRTQAALWAVRMGPGIGVRKSGGRPVSDSSASNASAVADHAALVATRPAPAQSR